MRREPKDCNRRTVKTSNGDEISTLVFMLMDWGLTEELDARGIEDEQEYFDAYCELHKAKTGNDFVGYCNGGEW